MVLTHWGRVTLICVDNLTIIGSDNGLSPGRRQAIIWTNAWILLIGPLGTNFIEMLIEIHTFSFKKIHLKMLSGKWQPFCLGLNVLTMKDNQALVFHGKRFQLSVQSLKEIFKKINTLFYVPEMASVCKGFRCNGFSFINSSPSGQNGCHFTDDIFRCIFVNEKFCILIKISLKFVPKSPIDNNSALV